MSIYVNVTSYQNDDFPFQIFLGGRGTGKTFSALSMINDSERSLLLVRRTATEVEMLEDSAARGEGLNPFKPINNVYKVNYGIKSMTKNLAGIYQRTEAEGKLNYVGAPLGYAVALTTMATIRGADFSGITDIIADEFIPEAHVKTIKNEADAWFNLIETVNRNREFDGKPSVRVWFLANANNLDNPLFQALGLISEVEKMRKQNKTDRYIRSKGLAIHILPDTGEFTAKKKETALYKLTEGSTFSEMALHNNFSYNDFSLVGYRNLSGYEPYCAIDDIYIYRKKGERLYYCSYAKSKVDNHYDTSKAHEVKQMCRKELHILSEPYIRGQVYFETFDIKSRLLEYL